MIGEEAWNAQEQVYRAAVNFLYEMKNAGKCTPGVSLISRTLVREV